MTGSSCEASEDESAESGSRWSLLGLGGAVSLCCLFAAPATGSAVGGTVAGGATAALGGGVVRILVSALTVGLLGLALRYRAGSCAYDQTAGSESGTSADGG